MTTQPLVVVRQLCIDYPLRRARPWAAPRLRRVVDRVDLTLDRGETLGLVGESGSGKTTIGQALLGLREMAAGDIRIGGWDVAGFWGRVPFAYRRVAQMVWQNPYGSLTPTMTAAQLIAEPLRREGVGRAARRQRADAALEQVGLRSVDGDKRPHEFSGGQRQRIALARTLVMQPQLIVLDEPVSALDVITQSQILRLLEEVQRQTGVSYLLISHDIGVVRYLANRVAVLYRGRIVESGSADNVFDRPQNPYTQQLVSAVLEPRALAPS
jgi:ABC-type microcin C transport system duplicated ATPase subunit YejF